MERGREGERERGREGGRETEGDKGMYNVQLQEVRKGTYTYCIIHSSF